jgi:hypothetical protein
MVFDLSRIENRLFAPLLSALETEAVATVRSLTFTLDLNFESRKADYASLESARVSKIARPVKQVCESPMLAGSAFRKIAGVIDSLLKSVQVIVSRSVSLTRIGFRYFQFTHAQIAQLSAALSQSQTIHCMSFETIPMFDSGFGTLANAFRREGITSIIVRACGLTDRSIDTVKSLLSFHSSLQRQAEWKASLEVDGVVETICIQSLDLRENGFTALALEELADVLQEIPITNLDLRDNRHVPRDVVAAIRRRVPHVSIKVNATVKKKGPQKRAKPARGSKRQEFVASDPAPPAQRVDEEGFVGGDAATRGKRKPRKDRDDDESERITLGPGVYAAGRRASEFLNVMTRLCDAAEDVCVPKRKRNK